ncbi:efflux RND transporter permease subunit [Arenicella xantha]|uniref:Multidrug efflux pump subunit AcrB n=1 Tax=Arenicella xantha TaxID=644221 RepID=A0A395JIT8_9GAMM|nr:efflux RND transporter permease subunit [Arenicella xantha]RBP49689.1 multidrug efflux pump subunit AcrB [Arenicella xantha]
MIKWFAKNHVAANLLMFGIIIMGTLALTRDIALELLPDFQLDTITITTVLPGGNPRSIEETITTRIEEAIADIEGLEKVTSRSAEDISLVFAQIESGYDDQEILSDVKIRVDALSTLPQDAERPVIQIADVPIQVIGLAVYGAELNYDDLYQTASDTREALLRVDGVSQVGPIQGPGRELHIEVAPQTLEQYNLTLADIGLAIQRNSVDISAGNLKTRDGDILVRTNGQAYRAPEFRRIPITNSGDQVVYLGDIATVTDGYQLVQVETQYNGEDALTFEAFRVGKQSTIDISDKVKKFIVDYQDKLPAGAKLGTYGETAKVVESRLSTLVTSAWQGGLLVMILLALFLRPAVAVWVGIGIPVCFLGAFALMPALGLSLNMLTMFAFLIVLGIVVDDAIVTGENIYRHMRNGMPPQQAAVFGTEEVAIPVTFGVVTTMIAFAPLLAVEGTLSTFAKQIPLVVIPVLAFSLIESKLILPAHMSTIKARDENDISWFGRTQQNFSRGFESTIIRIYRPFLARCVKNKTITVVSALCVFIVVITLLSTGWVRSSFAPDFVDDAVYVRLTMPSTTGYQTTKKYVHHIVKQANELSKEYVQPETGEPIFKYIISVSGLTLDGGTGAPSFGTNKGIVIIEVEPSENRPEDFSISKVQEQLRARIGDIPGAEKMSLTSTFGDFGRPISVAIYGNDETQLAARVDDIREYLKQYPGVYDIQDNYSSGKEEVQLEITPLADSLGLSLSNISSQVRQAVFGFEAQRIQRGQDELKVMVRYPLEYRSSMTDVENMPISVGNSSRTIPLSQLADLVPNTSPSAIYRDRQRRTVTVSANLDKTTNDVEVIRRDLTNYLDEMFAQEPLLTYTMDGEAENQRETNASFALGFLLVIIMIYALLAIPFKSFSQPFIVMSIIPLAIVGAILGHLILGLPFSMLSIMGILALTGIVVNDSLVLVDYINQQRLKGVPVMEAVLTAGEIRFRPVMLTSMTTFVGLLPLMVTSDTQSQALVPMAVSLGFGILFATLITLIIIPVNYLIFHYLGLWWNDQPRTSADLAIAK